MTFQKGHKPYRKPAVRKRQVIAKNEHEEKKMEQQVLEPAVKEEPKPVVDSPEVPVSENATAKEAVEALTDPRFARDMQKYTDPSDVKDPSGNWVYGMIDPLHRDHVGLQYWQPITWDIVEKEHLEIPFNPMIRSSAEQKGDNLVRQGTLIYARVKREVAEEIRRRNTEKAILKVKSVAPKKLARELNSELARRGLAKDYQMVVLGEDTILIGKR
uniref:Uncharacterized protein n=1 Tax=viral metagenome TaxID=1070528 RepID=A0A6M3KWD6_9ZZZZ